MRPARHTLLPQIGPRVGLQNAVIDPEATSPARSDEIVGAKFAKWNTIIRNGGTKGHYVRPPRL